MVVEVGLRRSSRATGSKRYKQADLETKTLQALKQSNSSATSKSSSTRSKGKKTQDEGTLDEANEDQEDQEDDSLESGDAAEEDDEEDDEESDSDEEYVESGKRRKPQKLKNGKRTKVATTIEQLGDDFSENELYKALSDPEVSVQTLAIEWIESFHETVENNGIEAITNLINLLLRCCGCIHLFQPHDLMNLDSAAETVGELTIAFKQQKSHEYPFVSNHKDLKFFKSNVIEFFQAITELSHSNGLLYIKRGTNEEGESLASPLINQIFTWLLTLTNCSIRPLRYISTSVLMSIQCKLCDLIVDIANSLERHQRQLNNAKNAKRKQQAKIETIENNIRDLNHQRQTIMEYLHDITETAFIHRYRDIDPLIRQDCINALCYWMTKFPEFFFQSSYLRYFGWLLSDPTSAVRVEVTKCLDKLYKMSTGVQNSIMASGFRQFTEKFKKQMELMAYKDTDAHVRLNATVILTDLVRLGLLEYNDQLSIVRNFMTLIETGIGQFGKVNNEKLKYEYARFIHSVNAEKFNSYNSSNEDLVASLKSTTSLEIDECMKIKSLIDVLKESEFKQPIESLRDVPKANNFEGLDLFSASTVFKNLYHLAFYQKTWEFLLRYFTFDISSIKLEDESDDSLKSFRDSLELSLIEDKYYLLCFIHGALSALVLKKKYEEGDVDNPRSVVTKIMEFLEPLLNELIKSTKSLEIFLGIWSLLLSDYNKFDNVLMIFQNSDRISLYDDINQKLFAYYTNYDVSDSGDSLLQTFEQFFSILIGSTTDTAMTPSLKSSIDSILTSLKVNVSSYLESYNNADDSNEMKILLLDQVSKTILKVNKLGNYTDIDKFVDISDELNTGTSILALFELLNLEEMAINSTFLLLEKIDIIIESYKIIVDLYLISNSSKFERLLKSESDSNQIEFDIPTMFNDSIELLSITINSLKLFDSAVNSLNERIGSSSISISIANTKTLIEKLNDLRVLFAIKFIDIIVSFKVFYEKFKSGNNYFRHFNEFFNKPEIECYIKHTIPTSVQNKLLSMFLIQEYKLAHRLSVELDRNDDEGVGYTDDATEHKSDLEIASSFQDEDMDNEHENEDNRYKEMINDLKSKQQLQRLTWKSEKDLCVFTVKLYTLIDLGLVHTFVEDRIKLNAKKIGGLFGKIVQQHESQGSESTDESANNTNSFPTDPTQNEENVTQNQP